MRHMTQNQVVGNVRTQYYICGEQLESILGFHSKARSFLTRRILDKQLYTVHLNCQAIPSTPLASLL